MLLNKENDSFIYEEKKYAVGDIIVANAQSPYEGLVGIIVEIRDGVDKTTDSETPEILCTFEPPKFGEQIKKYEERFTRLYRQKMTLDIIAFDSVIMAPEHLMSKEESENEKSSICIYSLKEECCIDGVKLSNQYYFIDKEIAQRQYQICLIQKKKKGVIAHWAYNKDFVETEKENTYECYLDGYYYDYHYYLEIQENKLPLSEQTLKKLVSMVTIRKHYADFLEYIEKSKARRKIDDDQITKENFENTLVEYCKVASEIVQELINEYLQNIKEEQK